MDVLIGECTGKYADEAHWLGWGRMWIARDRNIYTYRGEPWGLDNGAFRDWKDGKPFDADLYRRVLDKALARPEPPMLAVIPDAPGNGPETLRMAEKWLPELPAHFPWYLAVQDGMGPEDVDLPIAGIFLGGSDAYKATAPEWREWSAERGLPFHFGRCGTDEKIALAVEIGADSIDSALVMWTDDRWRWFVETMTNGPIQQALVLR